MGKINFPFEKYKNQILAGIAINLISLAHGTMLGWMSPTIHLLYSENSPFEQYLTIEAESWIGSCISVGGFTGTIISGLLMDRIGRKFTLLMLGIGNMSACLTIYFSNEIFHLYIARFLTGLSSGGLYIVIPIFIAEIADNNIRGSLGAMILFIVNIGLTTGYILTSYLPYRIVPVIIIWIPIIYTILVVYLPETPRFLLLSGKELNAEMSYKFYKNFKGNTKTEFQKFTRDFEELKNSLKSSMSSDSKLKLKDFNNPVAIKGIIVGVVLAIHNQVTGPFVILNYATKIFVSAGVTLDPNLCTILMGVTQMIGTYCATMLVDRFGRKPLFIMSLIGMLFGLVLTGIYDYLNSFLNLYDYSWIPIISVSFAIFSASFGINPLPMLIIVEMVPGKIRSTVSMFCMLVISFCAFTTLKVFPILMNILNLYGVMWVCSIFCCTGIIFLVLVVPETRGKELQENVQVNVEENKC